MKYLEAQKAAGREQKNSVLDPENKMQSGTRPGQRGNNLNRNDPQSLISGSQGSKTTKADAAVTKLAGELNVDLTTVKGTGANGAITEKDVRSAHDEASK